MRSVSVGIYVFDQVEVLDFAGPFEIFSLAGELMATGGTAPFRVFTLSENVGMVTARNGLRIISDFGLDSAFEPDILIIPGGPGIQQQYENNAVVEWIGQRAGKAEVTASVCNGAFMLAKAGLLSGKQATTHWEAIDVLKRMYPDIVVRGDRRFVDQVDIVTAAGVSSGIDLSLHLVWSRSACTSEANGSNGC